MDSTDARNARAEAEAIVGPGHRGRVLEPSPPADTDEPYWADDPVAVDDEGSESDQSDGHPDGHRYVVPAGMASDGDGNRPEVGPGAERIDWNQWLAADPGNDKHRSWVTEHWLGGDRRLPIAPSSLVETRTALHRLAAYVIAPVRHQATGKFGLRWTSGGFGTPFFGNDRQIRVDGRHLVDQQGAVARRTEITTLRAAADFLDTSIDPDTAAEHDSPPVGDPDGPLDVDADAIGFLNAWFAMAFAALELVRADAASVDPTRPQLWPGHFDPAIEVGTDATRASYGASPGDDGSDEPYLYVSVWWPDRVDIDPGSDGFWNARQFVGRTRPLSELMGDADPVEGSAAFWRETRDRLHSS